jgi:hypothetical protein
MMTGRQHTPYWTTALIRRGGAWPDRGRPKQCRWYLSYSHGPLTTTTSVARLFSSPLLLRLFPNSKNTRSRSLSSIFRQFFSIFLLALSRPKQSVTIKPAFPRTGGRPDARRPHSPILPLYSLSTPSTAVDAAGSRRQQWRISRLSDRALVSAPSRPPTCMTTTRRSAPCRSLQLLPAGALLVGPYNATVSCHVRLRSHSQNQSLSATGLMSAVGPCSLL